MGQNSDIVDALLQAKRDGKAAERFFKHILDYYHHEIRVVTTDKLRSYNVSQRNL